MGESFLDAMGSIGSNSEFSEEEIARAAKLKKKHGGTLRENLERLRGETPSDGLVFGGGTDPITAQLAANHERLSKEIRELNANIERDFGIRPAAVSQTETAAASAPEETKALEGEEALEVFEGTEDAVKQHVFGQAEYIKRLVIAFKRPFVMPPEGKQARNSLLVTGKPDTGRHYGLEKLAEELKERKILKNADISRIDLTAYSDSAAENLFVQDIYAALAGPAQILLFENPEGCHPSFLTQLNTLVTEGIFKLPGRYIMQKGNLVNVQNSLASSAVSEITAEGKYLVFLTEKSLDKAAGILGAPFIDALKGDVCQTGDMDEEAYRRIAETELAKLKDKAGRQVSLTVSADDSFLAYSAHCADRQAGVRGILDFYEKVLQALAQARLEGDIDKGTELVLTEEGGKVSAKRGEERIDLSRYLPERYRGEIEEIRKELDGIIGLTEVKKYILSLEEYYGVQKRREEQGLKTGEVNKHMIFTGNPGTGKTTIARIVSKYLKAIGVLTGGQLVEVSRADLVGRYVGHTAPLTNQVIQSAIGGVLFIDEAYSLYRGKDDSYGLEAIDTLVKGIEDNRDNLIVILAGYSHEMAEFLTANSGLKSRFPNLIDFPDYTGEELYQIARSIASSKGYEIDESAREPLTLYFDTVQAVNAAEAGNGRFARNLVEEAILNQSRRLTAEPEASLTTLLLSDFETEERKI